MCEKLLFPSCRVTLQPHENGAEAWFDASPVRYHLFAQPDLCGPHISANGSAGFPHAMRCHMGSDPKSCLCHKQCMKHKLLQARVLVQRLVPPIARPPPPHLPFPSHRRLLVPPNSSTTIVPLPASSDGRCRRRMTSQTILRTTRRMSSSGPVPAEIHRKIKPTCCSHHTRSGCMRSYPVIHIRANASACAP